MVDSILIEKYFSGNLSEEELLEFEKRYENNTEFRQEIDFLKNLKAVSKAEDTQQFKATLQRFESEAPKKQTPSLSNWLKPLTAAAAVLVIALAISFFWPTKTNPEILFASYFQPSKNVTAPIVRSENEVSTRTNAFIAYSEMDYEKASALFESAYASDKNSELLFYEGNALLASGHTQKAIEKFKEHLKFQDVLTNRSHWYLALGYLKNKELENAKEELEKFIHSNEIFKNAEAKLLLEKLK
ncbi:MAG: tetratricopeptide repeat protein [Aequorivita sp.]|nr:tetratricopeptide repeat protein [Aequorivita sp.]